MKTLWLRHLRDIVILPFTVTCVVPLLVYDQQEDFIPDNRIVKISGAFMLVAGLSLFAYTVFLFTRIGKGTLAPWSPKEKLIVAGPYRYCRNPMITGVWFILLGEALVFHSINILIWSFVFFLINTVYFIFAEEPGLLARFGEDYQNYKQHVPRWIPKIRAYRK